MMASLRLYAATVAAFLVASAVAQDVLVTTTVNETHCATQSNVGNFFHYGSAMANKGGSIYAIQYEGKNATCCQFDYANDLDSTNMPISPSLVSATLGASPCSALESCKNQEQGCDEHAECVLGQTSVFQCQCTDDYEGDGYTCTRKPHWSEYGPFGPYSQSCGIATKTRTRTCSIPPRCEGNDTETVTVHLKPCPIPTTTTLPPTRYMACGSENCEECSGDAKSCKEGNLDAVYDEEDLRDCPEGFVHHSILDVERWWILPDEVLRVCASLPPAPVAKYRYQLCGVLNCIGCQQEECRDQDPLHLVPSAEEAGQGTAQCPEGYSDFQTNDVVNAAFRTCRSDEKFF